MAYPSACVNALNKQSFVKVVNIQAQLDKKSRMFKFSLKNNDGTIVGLGGMKLKTESTVVK